MSWLNRGTNFSSAEREELRLEGLLPPVIESLELQVRRAHTGRTQLVVPAVIGVPGCIVAPGAELHVCTWVASG